MLNMDAEEIIVKSKINNIRGKQVMLDSDLAGLYGIETRSLKQAVKRNIERFPGNFMFELKELEINLMVSQNVIPSKKHLGGAKPYVFTEQGVAMLSSVLRSRKAIEVNIKIMNAFVAMRNFLLENKDVFNRLDNLERKQIEYQIKTDESFEKSHDRFLIIDEDFYHFGASLKDLGKKWFAFSKLPLKKDIIMEELPE
jgi:hypothetical protein